MTRGGPSTSIEVPILLPATPPSLRGDMNRLVDCRIHVPEAVERASMVEQVYISRCSRLARHTPEELPSGFTCRTYHAFEQTYIKSNTGACISVLPCNTSWPTIPVRFTIPACIYDSILRDNRSWGAHFTF